jgi:hypothetical protein
MEPVTPAAKNQVRELLDRLPDDCTLEDVLYHLYAIEKIREGLGAAEKGQLIPHEQVDQELRQKWLLGRAG